MASGENGVVAKKLITQKELIENQIYNLYQKMKDSNELSEHVIPKLTIKIVDRPSIWAQKPPWNRFYPFISHLSTYSLLWA